MSDELISLIETKRDLPPIPEVLINLEKRVNDPDWDIIEIYTIIETEPVLSGRLIQLSNSVLFEGGREKFVDVQGSIIRLGIKMVLDLAYTVLLIGVFKKTKDFNQFNFWTHSLSVVYLTRSLAHIVKISYDKIEFAYMCWLMHDVGILVFDHLIPDQYTELLKKHQIDRPHSGWIWKRNFW